MSNPPTRAATEFAPASRPEQRAFEVTFGDMPLTLPLKEVALN